MSGCFRQLAMLVTIYEDKYNASPTFGHLQSFRFQCRRCLY